MRRPLWVAANGLMAIAFLFSILVQLNDPDPFRWIAVYALALIACGLELLDRSHWSLPAAAGLIAGIWAVSLAPLVLGHVPFFAMFGDWEMHDVGIERSREMYGLLGIVIWMAVLVMAAARRRAAREDP
jgi:hypothetical protein